MCGRKRRSKGPHYVGFRSRPAAFEAAAAGELASNNRPNDDVNALTPVEQLARPWGGPPLISEGLRQQPWIC